MRKHTLRWARNAKNVVVSEGPSSVARAPFICTSCRRASEKSTPPSAQARRLFTASTPRLQQQQSPIDSQQLPRREVIAPQSHYDLFPLTFPNGPPPSSPFTPDLRQLRKEYLQLQAKSHPDLAPADRKRHAEALSMRLNEAYKTLQDPLRRAQYLLSLHGIDVEDESAKLEESELLMEVMEAREAVDEVEDEAELVGLREENNERIDASVGVLEESFGNGQLDRAAQEAVRLRYWVNIEESIQGWEPGKGGGLVHH